jgi:hypothetical protein
MSRWLLTAVASLCLLMGPPLAAQVQNPDEGEEASRQGLKDAGRRHNKSSAKKNKKSKKKAKKPGRKTRKKSAAKKPGKKKAKKPAAKTRKKSAATRKSGKKAKKPAAKQSGKKKPSTTRKPDTRKSTKVRKPTKKPSPVKKPARKPATVRKPIKKPGPPVSASAARKKQQLTDLRRQRNEKIRKLTPAKKARLKTLHARALAQRDKARRPASRSKRPLPGKRPVPAKYLPRTGLTRANRAALANLGKTDAKVRSALSRLQKQGKLSKRSLDHLKQIGLRTRDPQALIGLHRLTNPSPFVSDRTLQTLLKLEKRTSLTGGEKQLLHRYLHGQPLSRHHLVLAKNLLDRPGLGTANRAALIQMISHVQEQQVRQDFLSALQNRASPLNPIISPSGGLLPGADETFPPLVPCLWFPNDPNAEPGPDVVPAGSGVCAGVSAGSDLGALAGVSHERGQSEERAQDLGSVALDDPVEQTCRYLRVTNATREKITVWIQYRTQDDRGRWAWYPANPKGSERAVRVALDPGETVDLTDQGWRVSASRIRFWARSQSRQWVTFKEADLWLVPEVGPDDSHGYNAAEVQTFDLTVR